MAKQAVQYACTECGYSAGRWFGKCPGCDAFGTLSSCVAIPGATSSTYLQTTADVGHALRVWVTGKNLPEMIAIQQIM